MLCRILVASTEFLMNRGSRTLGMVKGGKKVPLLPKNVRYRTIKDKRMDVWKGVCMGMCVGVML